MSLQVCNDVSDLVELCDRYCLYLKPLWKIKICVQLPILKIPGQTISSWEVMEKLKKMVKPEEFNTLKVSKTNQVLMQFEAELDNKTASKRVLQKLQSNTMKLSGFADVLKIRAAEAKLNYPSRHDWDSFYRDAKNVNEMKPGERPDTVYLENIPTKWFMDPSSDSNKPSDFVLKKVFETFGDIRRVDIPSKYDTNNTFGKISTFHQELVFNAYIQYKEYMGFVKAMDSLKGMKLVYNADDRKALTTELKVNFDKTSYLSDKAIAQRLLLQKQKKALEKKLLKSKPIQITVPVVQELKRKSPIKLEKKGEPEPVVDKKRKLNKAMKIRKKEATFLLKELLERTKIEEMNRRAKEKEEEIERERKHQQDLLEHRLREEIKHKLEQRKQKKKFLMEQERLLRDKLLKNLKDKEQKRSEELREKLRKEISGKNVLKSVLATAHCTARLRSYKDVSRRYNRF